MQATTPMAMMMMETTTPINTPSSGVTLDRCSGGGAGGTQVTRVSGQVTQVTGHMSQDTGQWSGHPV